MRAKYGKSPQNFLSIFTSRQLKLSLNVLIRSIYLSIMETTRWDLSNDMSFVLVYCCVGMLMTSCFGGSTPILGRKRITLLQPISLLQIKSNTKLILFIVYFFSTLKLTQQLSCGLHFVSLSAEKYMEILELIWLNGKRYVWNKFVIIEWLHKCV